MREGRREPVLYSTYCLRTSRDNIEQMSQQLELFVPDRFDMLQRKAPSQLDSIVVPVEDGLTRVKALHRDMIAASRGGFLLMRGDSGCGKSTFLNTLSLFLGSVDVQSIPRERSIEEALRRVGAPSADLRVVVIEGRDALKRSAAEGVGSRYSRDQLVY